MSTRSYICIEQEDGTYKGSYCHCDGYLTYNGAMLLDHYSEREKVEKLVSLGDMSALCENVEPDKRFPHSFDKPQDGVTIFYGRDRGETNTGAREVDLCDINSDDSWIEYCYVYGKDDKWRYFVCGQNQEPVLRDLEEGLKEEYEALGFKRPEGYYGFYTREDIELLRRKENEAEM